MKHCYKCKEFKQLTDFTINKSRKDGLNHACKPCHRDTVQKHYKANKEAYLIRTKIRNTEQRKKSKALINLLKSKPCTDCKNIYPPYVMDFDHVRDQKEFNIGAANGRLPIDRILEEIKKCELVCSNCHRIRTHKRAAIT